MQAVPMQDPANWAFVRMCHHGVRKPEHSLSLALQFLAHSAQLVPEKARDLIRFSLQESMVVQFHNIDVSHPPGFISTVFSILVVTIVVATLVGVPICKVERLASVPIAAKINLLTPPSPL